MPDKQWVEVPINEIPEDTLIELVQAFVLREGTDYGANEASMEAKVNNVMTQLGLGTSIIVFDTETESCTILSQVEYKQRQHEHRRITETR